MGIKDERLSEGQFEGLHTAWVFVQQVAQIGRRSLRVSDCQEYS